MGAGTWGINDYETVDLCNDHPYGLAEAAQDVAL
jgi:hypothetical protein